MATGGQEIGTNSSYVLPAESGGATRQDEAGKIPDTTTDASQHAVTNVLNQNYIKQQTNVENQVYNGPIFNYYTNPVHCSCQTMHPPPPPPFQRRQPPKAPDGYEDPAFFKRSKPVDVSILFSDEELERKVEQPYLVIVAKAFPDTKSWRRLARKLKLDSPSFGYVEDNYRRDSTQEKVYQCLKIWIKRNPQSTVRDLVAGLVESELYEVALELRHSFHSLHCLEWNPDHNKEEESRKDEEKGEREKEGEKGREWEERKAAFVEERSEFEDEAKGKLDNEGSDEMDDENRDELDDEDEEEYEDKGRNKDGIDEDKDIDETQEEEEDSPIQNLKKKLGKWKLFK